MLKAFGATTVLGSVISRVRDSLTLDDIVILTSNDESDDALCEEARLLRVRVHRGPLENVASRFHEFLASENIEAFVRISGDSPLIDPALIDQGVELFRQSRADLATNVLRRTFPTGQSVEVVRTSAFMQSFPRFSDKKHFEHVTAFFYENPEHFALASFESKEDFSDVRLSVDYETDYEILLKVLANNSSEQNWKTLSIHWRNEILEGKA
jgi:spore coat polysaccharide biosynthesis protein SpsF